MTSWKLFFALTITASLMLGGALVFAVEADYDYNHQLNHESDHLEPRENSGGVGYGSPIAMKRHNMLHYDEMSPANQRKVDRAIDEGKQTYGTWKELPPGIVEKSGAYYYFDIWRDFDWTDPHTALPAAVSLFGLLASVKIVHLDVTGRKLANRI